MADEKRILTQQQETLAQDAAWKTLDKSIETFSQKTLRFAKEVVNLPIKATELAFIGSGTLIESVGEAVNLIDGVFFAAPSERNRLGGLIPLCMQLSESNKNLATRIESIMGAVTGVDLQRGDLFGYGWVGRQANRLASRIRGEQDASGITAAFRHALADLVEAFSNVVDALAKVLYSPAMAYRFTAEVSHRLVTAVQKLTNPIHNVLSNLSNLCMKMGNWLVGSGETLQLVNAVKTRVEQMRNQCGSPPEVASVRI